MYYDLLRLLRCFFDLFFPGFAILEMVLVCGDGFDFSGALSACVLHAGRAPFFFGFQSLAYPSTFQTSNGMLMNLHDVTWHLICHRSHFGSRYHIDLTHCRSLFQAQQGLLCPSVISFFQAQQGLLCPSVISFFQLNRVFFVLFSSSTGSSFF